MKIRHALAAIAVACPLAVSAQSMKPGVWEITHNTQGGAGGGGMSVKTCMTKEMIDRNEVPSQKGDCQTTKQQKTGNTMKFTVVCNSPPSTGEGQVTFLSPEAYTMKMAMQSKVDGRPQSMNMEASGKWLSADCGAIKPPAAAMKK